MLRQGHGEGQNSRDWPVTDWGLDARRRGADPGVQGCLSAAVRRGMVCMQNRGRDALAVQGAALPCPPCPFLTIKGVAARQAGGVSARVLAERRVSGTGAGHA